MMVDSSSSSLGLLASVAMDLPGCCNMLKPLPRHGDKSNNNKKKPGVLPDNVRQLLNSIPAPSSQTQQRSSSYSSSSSLSPLTFKEGLDRYEALLNDDFVLPLPRKRSSFDMKTTTWRFARE